MHFRDSLIAFTIGVVALTPASRGQSNYATTVQNTPNLLGYWQYTAATQANSSVNGYTGSFSGSAALGGAGSGPTLAGDPGNRAVVLNGTTDAVYTNLTALGNSPNTVHTTGAGTIIGWFKLTALPSTLGHIFLIGDNTSVQNDFGLQIETDNQLKFYTDSGSATVDNTAFTASDLNVWHFFAATVTSNTVRNIYLDGALVASSTPGAIGTNGAGFSMGNGTTFNDRFFDGSLDEIAVFNRQLSGTEIASIYGSRLVVPEPSACLCLAVGLGLAAVGYYRRRMPTEVPGTR